MKAKIAITLLHAYDDAKAEVQALTREPFYSPLALNLRRAEAEMHTAAKAIADQVLESWSAESAPTQRAPVCHEV